MRTVLLDLYTDQVMDNLIRTSNGMPIVQLDYSDITGTVTQSSNASYGGEQTLGTDRNDVGLIVLRSFSNMFNYGIGGSNENQLTISANPVLNNNEVYNAYLEFLAKPERLVMSCEPPPPGAAHIVRCVPQSCGHGLKHSKEKLYYWVPAEYGTDFFRLSMVTTVQRGQPLSTPEFFENTIEDAIVSTPEGDKKHTRLTLVFEKSLPNDNGLMRVPMGDTTLTLRLSRFTTKVDGEEVPSGKMTTQLWILLPQKEVPELTAEKLRPMLLGKKVRIDLDNYRPTLTTTEDLFKSVRRNVNLIRLNQIR
jgi:hypothetical protein